MEKQKLKDFELYLYVGTSKIHNLAHVEEGITLDYSQIDIYSNDYQSTINAQHKLDSLQGLGKDYSNIYITYIPAIELEYYNNSNKFTSSLPKELLIPLLKSNSELSHYKAFCSGKRSVILSFADKLYRLKGIGNLDIGFNLNEVLEVDKNHFEIFGAQFKNSCLRELHITNKLSNQLEKYRITCGNKPLGFWRYPKFSTIYNDLNFKNDAPLLEKYCGLYETLGERRLGEHLFHGVNIFLRIIFMKNSYFYQIRDIINLELISKLLPSKNYNIDDKEVKFNDFALLNDICSDINNIELSEDEFNKKNKFFDFLDFVLNRTKEKNLNTSILNLERELLYNYFDKKTNKNNENFRNEIKYILNTLFISLETKKLSLFCLLQIILAKISYEMGKIKKIFEKNTLNWGTFDFHSNSHLDNFIILPHEKSNSNFNYIAPIDFDLAFYKEEFIDFKYVNPKDPNRKIFDELITSEKNNLLIQLSGFNTITNINVSILDLNEIENTIKDDEKKYIRSFRNLCIENMQNYFAMGYNLLDISKVNFLDFYYNEGSDLIKILFCLLEWDKENQP